MLAMAKPILLAFWNVICFDCKNKTVDNSTAREASIDNLEFFYYSNCHNLKWQRKKSVELYYDCMKFDLPNKER